MEIVYFGDQSFRLKTKTAVVVTNPVKPSKVEADIITLSRPTEEAINEKTFVINLPGEYEIKGISIFGFPSEENIIYLIEADGLRICHLGLSTGLPSTSILEEITGVDVLMISSANSQQAAETISKIEPLLIVPMGEDFKDFLGETGAEQAEKLEKLSITKEKLPKETKVVILEKK